MKILHLITRLILGGAQENTVLSCEGQVRQGHRVTLAHGPIYGPEGSLAQRAAISGARIVELSAMEREVRPLTDRRCYRQCRELIGDLKPDVVHTHSSKAGILGRYAAWGLNVPAVVHTIHGLPFHPYQSRWKNWMYIAAERRAARRCHKIVVVADAMTRQALAAGVGRPEQYLTIHSAMETGVYLHAPHQRDNVRRAMGFDENDFVIGTVARLAELKGHDDLLDALGDVVQRHANVKLLWVGDGWRRRRLEQRIARLGWTGRITLTGLVEPDRIPGLMSAMDLLVHPSYREGLPRTVPQALLCRTPVVVYDADGAAEVCRDGRTGRLVKTGDIAGLSEAMMWMVEHESERIALAERGRTLCTQMFDCQNMIDRLDRLYRQVLQERLP